MNSRVEFNSDGGEERPRRAVVEFDGGRVVPMVAEAVLVAIDDVANGSTKANMEANEWN